MLQQLPSSLKLYYSLISEGVVSFTSEISCEESYSNKKKVQVCFHSGELCSCVSETLAHDLKEDVHDGPHRVLSHFVLIMTCPEGI